MATVARITAPVQHYAYYGDLYGLATLVCGSGYLFGPRASARPRW